MLACQETQYVPSGMVPPENSQQSQWMPLILSKQANCHLQLCPNLSVLREMKSIYFFSISIKCTLHALTHSHRLPYPCASND